MTTGRPTRRRPTTRAAQGTYIPVAAPSSLQLHYLNRLAWGYSPRTFSQMRSAGGETAWLEQQLSPALVPESPLAAALPSWFPALREEPAVKWQKSQSGVMGHPLYARELACLGVLRRTYTSRQLLETMVDFWSNHLHVHADADLGWAHRASYDDTVRQHALGRFEDLLVAASLHPAMLLYLDNWRSEAGAPNENQGRELLELHTVDRESGYTEAMVKDSAKILSGYTVDAFKTWQPLYSPGKHTTGPVQVLGFTSANASSDGQQVTKDYLRYLANHPGTARSIARKLCLRFVGEHPSTSLVTAVAQAFRDSGTDIKTTLRALFAHRDFAASEGTLVRNPISDLVATMRLLDVQVAPPTGAQSFARTFVYLPGSLLLYHWPRPDGSPESAAAWTTAGGVLNSFRMHMNLVTGWNPVDVTYRTPSSWLPQASLRFDQLVAHLCRVMLGRPATDRVLTAALQTTHQSAATVVTASHPVITWQFGRLVTALLDSPDHPLK